MDLLDFQRHCPAIVGYSSAHSHAPRLPDIQVKGTSAGNFARLELYNKFARSMNTDDNVSLGASTVF